MVRKSRSSRVVIILDYCYSGSATLSRGYEEEKARVGDAAIDNGSRMLRGEGRCILAGSQALQEAYILEEKNHSLFTFYLLQGLQGKDREALDNQGNVTVDTLSKYVYQKIMSLPRERRPKQKPLRKVESSGDIILIEKTELKNVGSLKNEIKEERMSRTISHEPILDKSLPQIQDKTKMVKPAIQAASYEPDEVKFIQIPSDFPLEHRPIIPLNVAYLNYNNLQSNEIKLAIAKTVDNLMTMHKNDKGIIHTTSYEQLNFIKENISQANARRLLVTDPEIQRDDVIFQHTKSTIKPTVLISPSLHTGLDLKDELSRFQIITKVPYPNKSDRWLTSMYTLSAGG